MQTSRHALETKGGDYADVIDWLALTALMTTTPEGRAMLGEAGRMMALVGAREPH
jgi:hypothetical protein